MNTITPTDLQQLKDIHLPAPISYWPNVPFLIFLCILMITLIAISFLYYKKKQKKGVIRFAFAKLEQLQPLMMDNPDNINIAAEISTLLRRTALHYFSRENIAGLSGQSWLLFLNQTGGTTQFTEDTGRLLTQAPYQKKDSADLTPLFDLARIWLKTISKRNVQALEK